MDLTMFQQTVVYVNSEYIAIMPLCDFFGITYKWQIEKIKKDPILKSEWKKTTSEIIFGDKISRVSLSKRGFIRWIQLLKPDLVSSHLQDKLIQFQSMIFDFMFGSIEKESIFKVNYNRLKKLKKIYGRIGNEIQRCEREVKEYLDSTYVQTTLNFSPSNHIQ